ncbi:MAG TPA: hypothetical protein PK765_07570 [bacterium]|nr:hypothetical protein [bacterium]
MLFRINRKSSVVVQWCEIPLLSSIGRRTLVKVWMINTRAFEQRCSNLSLDLIDRTREISAEYAQSSVICGKNILHDILPFWWLLHSILIERPESRAPIDSSKNLPREKKDLWHTDAIARDDYIAGFL